RKGAKNMSRSVHRSLSKNKLATGVGIGAIAMLAVAVPALSQPEGPGDNFKKDEVFQVTTVLQVPGGTFFSFDISWFDPKLKKFFLADRNNFAIDVVDATQHPGAVTQFHQAFAGFTGNNDTSGPDGVLTANNGKELWVGDSPGKVWVLDSGSGQTIALPAPATNPILITNPGPPAVHASTTRADELCYDPKDNLIMIASPAEDPMFVSFISTAGANKGQVVGQITFGAPATGLEQCQWNPTNGMFYQNVP